MPGSIFPILPLPVYTHIHYSVQRSGSGVESAVVLGCSGAIWFNLHIMTNC
uniref:Uncharacterized protein n=1 Tax=Anguilla anguilla TaxID=7936 RepID=A0A0E9X4E2_ANGAN